MVTQVHEHAQEAQRQQVCAGCHLLRIGDTPCRTLHFDEALRLIREGPRPLRLTLRRPPPPPPLQATPSRRSPPRARSPQRRSGRRRSRSPRKSGGSPPRERTPPPQSAPRRLSAEALHTHNTAQTAATTQPEAVGSPGVMACPATTRLSDVFAEHDADADGALSMEEIVWAVTALDRHFTNQSALNVAFLLSESDGAGRVGVTECVALYRRLVFLNNY